MSRLKILKIILVFLILINIFLAYQLIDAYQKINRVFMDEYHDLNFKALEIRGIVYSGISRSIRSGDNVTAKHSMAALKEVSGDFMLRWHHLVFFGELFGKLGGVEVEYISECVHYIGVDIIQWLAYRFIEEDRLSVGEIDWLEEFANVILEVQDSVHYYILGLGKEDLLGDEKIVNGSIIKILDYTPPTPDNAVRKLIELMRKARTLGYSVVIPTYPPIIS
jgi:hypothetical protein